MTSITDSVVNVIIILAAVLVLGTFVTTTLLKNSAKDVMQDRNVFLEERTELAVDAILVSTENATGKSIGELLGVSMTTLQTVVSVDGREVDLVNATRERLDRTFGRGNYYVRIEPIIQGVNLMFVLDSSRTVEEEREAIVQNIQAIQDRIQSQIEVTGKEKVSVQIFFLPTNGDNGCPAFTDLGLPDLTCEQWTSETLYQAILERGWERPGFQAGRTYDAWSQMNFAADIMDFAPSDWAAGVAAASLRYETDPFLQSRTSLNLIFPLSDELATTSKGDVCFNWVEDWKFLICSLCASQCPVQRSLDAVEQAVTFVQQTDSLVFPIYSVNCDYSYVAGYNQLSSRTEAYITQFKDDPSATFGSADYPATTWCHQDACGGCSVQSDGELPEPDFCFHGDCKQALRDQMEYLARETNGSVFDVNDAAQIPDNIISAFDLILASYNFEVGFQDGLRDRFVYEKAIVLPNGALGNVEVWIYTDPHRTCYEDEACETQEGCPGVRACAEGNLSETCVKDDPSCVGRPCTGPELCIDGDGCPGLKECADEDGDGQGVLSPVCVKSSPICTAVCVPGCPDEGRVTCNETSQGSGVYLKSVCAPDENGCLRWEPFKLCNEPCQNEHSCGEDPICPLDCSLDGLCNEACSQNGLCGFDGDCEARCDTSCWDDGTCNIWCSAMHPDICPLDLDCPFCMNRRGDSCRTNDDPGCCGPGTTFIWAQRYYAVEGFRSLMCEQDACFGQCTNDFWQFGMCCAQSTDCVVWEGRAPACVPQGELIPQYLAPDGEWLCYDNVMEPCRVVASCDTDPVPAYCTQPKTVPGVGTFRCNFGTGEWEMA